MKKGLKTLFFILALLIVAGGAMASAYGQPVAVFIQKGNGNWEPYYIHIGYIWIIAFTTLHIRCGY